MNHLPARFLPENEDAKWWIIVTADNCEQACRQWLEVSRSVHRRLHRDADRVRRGFVVADGSVPDPADHPRIVTLNGPDGGNPFPVRHAPVTRTVPSLWLTPWATLFFGMTADTTVRTFWTMWSIFWILHHWVDVEY